MAQQADSEAISLVIQKLTEIVEKQNRHSSTDSDVSDDSGSIHQVAADNAPSFLEHGSEILLAEDSIAVAEEVVGASPCSSFTSPAKSDQGHLSEEEHELRRSPRQVLLGSGLPEPEQVILNFPVKVGNINITNTEGLIATLQKLDSALQQDGDSQSAKVTGSEDQGQLQHVQGQLQGQGQAKELYKCAKCDYCSHNKHYLKQHVELTHNADRPFKCPFCNYAGKRSHSLKEHLIVHSNCRPYSCMYCNATFRKKGHLTNHVKMHVNHDGLSRTPALRTAEGETVSVTYQCGSCSFVASSLQTLSAHVQTHDAGLMCKTCDMYFADAQSLTMHINSKHAMNTATATATSTMSTTPQKEVILVCSECGYKTCDKELLTDHMMKHVDASDNTEEATTSEQENQTEASAEIKSGKEDIDKMPEDTDAQEAGYKCAQCSFTTKTAVTFIQHMLLHKPQRQVKTEPSSSTSSTEISSTTVQAASGPGPPQKQRTPAPDLAQPFTHDKTGNFYRCSICGYTCELQRTIKSHIWKHSGHHDIDYPMFRNGPISVYDDYPIGVPVLMSENAPVMQVEAGTSGIKGPQTSYWAAVPDPKAKGKGKETMLVRVQPKKPRTGATPTKDSGPRTRHKTISQILAESQQPTEGATEQEEHQIQGSETGAATGNRTTGLRHKPAILSPATVTPTSEAKPSPATLKLPIPVQYTGVAQTLSPTSPDGSTPKRTVVMMVPRHVHQAGSPVAVKSPTLPITSAQSLEATSAVVSPVADVTPTQTGCPPQPMNPLKVPLNVSLSGSEILKLILKNKLQPATSGASPPRTAESEVSMETERSPSLSVTAEAGSSVGDGGSSHGEEQASDVTTTASKAAAATASTATSMVKRKVESVDELELYRLAKKLCSQSQDVSPRNVVVEDVSQAYSTPRISLLDSRGASPRGQAYSPRSVSPRLALEEAPPRVLRGRSRSAEEVRKPPSQMEEDIEETQEQQPSVTLISLLKKGPNLNPACPPKTTFKDEKDGDKPKQGISSSLLAVIEQLRERSRSESDPDDSISGGATSEKPKTRRRGKRGSADDEEDRDALLQNYANIEQVGDQYRCKLCHYSSASAAVLKVHIRQHKVKKPLECSLCEFMARSNEELQDHMLKHCKVRTYQCKLCATETSFTYKSQLRAHMRVHAEQNPYLCDHCDFQGTLPELKQHMLKHDRVYYLCNTCEATFESQEEHRQHEAECPEQSGSAAPPLSPGQPRTKRLLQCTHCDFLTNSQTALLNHAAVHKGFEVQCELCNFTATSMRSLKSHMKRHINDQKFVRQPLEQYKCNLCGYVCHHLPSLKSHMWRHASDTNYSYQDSNDIINAAIDLDQGQGEGQSQGQGQGQAENEEKEKEKEGASHGHNNFIRFRCCQCGFESVDRSELNDHMQSHQDIIQKTLEVNRGRIITNVLKSTNNNSEDSGTEEDVTMETE